MSPVRNILFLLCLIAATSVTSVHAAGGDKVLHAGVSFGISVVAYNIYKENTEWTDNQVKVAAFATAMAFGLLKETLDDEFDELDLAADAGGAFVGAAIGWEF